MYVNIRGLNANISKLQVYIESLKVKPILIACAETRVLGDNYKKDYNFNNYNIYYNKSIINQNDRVVMFIRDDVIESTNVTVVNNLLILHSTIKLDKNNSLEVSALYRSHDLRKLEFIKDLKSILSKNQNYKNHCIIGDFNIDIMDIDITSQEFLQNFIERQYIPGFFIVTRLSNTQSDRIGTCINNIFIQNNTVNTKIHKTENLFMDHYPLFLSIDKIELNSKNNNISQNYINFNKLNKLLYKCNLHTTMSMQDPNSAMDFLISEIKNCIDKATSITNCNTYATKPKARKNWIIKGIMISCKTKGNLYYLWNKNRSIK